MRKRSHLMEKLKVKPRWKVRSCQDPGCDIFTNERYRSPAGRVVVACCFGHAEVACGG